VARRVVTRVLLLAVGVLVVGNVAILGLSLVARATTPSRSIEVAGVDNAAVIDERVWRGGSPTAQGYRNLVAQGVSTVVDLRSDSERGVSVEVLGELPVDLVRLPIRDGQLPTEDEIAAFIDTVESADGIVFVHCGAGVGRTGAMAAAYLAAVDGVGGREAVRRNLAIGPPSLEQIAFALSGAEHPPSPVTALSRVLDAPRRIWHNIT
jgi:protein tyrosine phosphatase (PTP) superfamily phosphohydrolase (DUF442 family)